MTSRCGVLSLAASIQTGLPTPTFPRVNRFVLGVGVTLYVQDVTFLGALQVSLWLFCYQNTMSRLSLLIFLRVTELDHRQEWSQWVKGKTLSYSLNQDNMRNAITK